TATSCRTESSALSPALGGLLKILRQKRSGKFPSLLSVVRPVALLVVWILESVSGVRKYVDVDRLTQCLQVSLELLHVGGGNAFILAAEDAQNGGVDLLQSCLVGGEVSVVDDRRLQL